MKRLRSTTVLRTTVCLMPYQKRHNLIPKCRRGHVQSRVASIEVMSNVGKEEGGAIAACRAYVG